MDRTALPPGARLGEFDIVRVLAVGGFGIVYLAHDRALDRDVAVKEFMPTHLAGRSDGQRVSVRSASDAGTYALGLQSFIEEARLLARLSHPAIVKVYRFWKGNGTGYMVMPYLRGPTLGDVRRSMSEPPTEGWLRRVTGPLLEALAVLHAEGFYHRDISPDNVLVGENGLPVLLDFGAARRVITNRTQTITAIVKPHFAPIEQYAEARLLKQGPWTDLYAFGALVSYLIDGTPPPASTARAIHDERVPLAGRAVPGISAGFLAVIDWALAVRPQDRPQDVAAFRQALARRAVPPAKPAALPPTRPDRARILPIRPRVGLRRSAWGAAAMTAAAAMVFAIARPPFDDAVASGTAPVAPPTSARAPAPVAARVAPASPPAPVAAVAAAPIEEIIEGPPERVIEAVASPEVSPSPSTAAAAVAPVPPRALSFASAQTERSSLTPAPSATPAKVRKTTTRRRAPERQLAGARARSPGPIELCAGRNFFMRPWCVQRRCDEPRFKGSAQCAPHQMARSAY
jgi:non-specific serine/threonine protein kinase